MAAGAAGALSGAACGTSVDLGSTAAGPSVEDLDRAAATPIVDLSGLSFLLLYSDCFSSSILR